MIDFAYNNRTIRLIKDILFVALGMWLASRASFLAVLVGILAIFWYGRDAYYQAKVLWQEKHYKEPESKAPKDNGKISLGSDAKEVNFEKE